MELVTGKAGTPHVSSADDGRRIAGEVGTGSYVLQTGGRLAPSLVDANTVRFATGDMVVQGRHIGLTAPEDVKVASGTQGKKRMDYICVHYKRDAAGSNPTLVETCEWKVLRGTPGTKATAPTVPAGSILDGDAEATVPVASVDFDGLTTGKPKLLIPVLTPLATLGDSVSHPLDTGWVFLYNDTTWGTVKYRARAGVCCLIISGIGGIGAGASWEVPNAIARKFLPSGGLYVPLVHRQKSNVAQAWIPGQNDVDSNGKLYIYSSMNTTDNFSRISGIVTWIYEPEPADPKA